MEIQTVEIKTQGTKELHELGLGVKTVIESTKKALSDGFQAGQDIPQVLLDSYQDLTKAIEGLDMADDEVKALAAKAIMGALIPVVEGVEILLEKKEA